MPQLYRPTPNRGVLGPISGTWTLEDISGNGLVKPAATPSPSQGVGGLAAGTYTVGYSYLRAGGESGLSTTANVTITAAHGITIAQINNIPLGVTACNFYFTAGPSTGFTVQQVPAAGTLASFTINSAGNASALPLAGGTVETATSANWNTAIAATNLRGGCVRVGWCVLSTDGLSYDFSILQPWLTSCANNNVGFALRIMAGQWTPPGFFAAGGANFYTGSSTSTCWVNPNDTHQGGSGPPFVPFPFDVSGNPHAAFETRYQAYADSVRSFALSNGVKLLHWATYGNRFSEVYFGTTDGNVKDATKGYSYNTFVTGHKRLYDIAYAASRGVGATCEFPLSGTGQLWQSGGTQVDLDLSTYALGKVNSATPAASPYSFFLQLNGFGPAPNVSGTATAVGNNPDTMTDSSQAWTSNQWQGTSVSLGGSTAGVASNTATVLTLDAQGWVPATPSPGAYTINWNVPVQYAGQQAERNDEDMQAQTYLSGIGHACQMIGVSNSYPWDTLFAGLLDMKYLEVYTASFVGGTSASLKTHIQSFNPGP